MTADSGPSTVQIDKLTGDNYPLWKFKMQLILEDKDVFSVVDGTDKKPTDTSARLPDWLKRDTRARVAICLRLNDAVLSNVRQCESAHSVWNKLKSLYESKSLVNRLCIRRKLLTLRMNESDTLSSHITVLRTLIEQLAAVGAPVSNDDQIMALLMSLPKSYEQVIT